MAFESGFLNDPVRVGAGERYGNTNVILSADGFEDGLKVGHFVQLLDGEIANLNETADPVIAGVPLRNVAASVESDGTVDASLYSSVEYLRQGLVTVRVAEGAEPVQFGRVYADNATGEALTTGGIPTAGEFIREVKEGVWLMHMAGIVEVPAPAEWG